jgi:hypothetical protein
VRQNPSKFAVVSEGKIFPRKNARRKRNMKNGIRVTARLVKQLAENQQDLVWEAYGMLRGDTEIAKEQNTSRQAIQNRRNKIKSRIEKLLMEL